MKKLTCFVTLFFLLIACRKEEMQTYRVPKSSDSANLPAGGATVAERPLANTPPPFDNTLLPEGHPPVVPALPPGHPEMGGGEMSMANASAQGLVPPSAPKGDVTWEVPRGWQEKPGSGFRYATFVIPGEGAITGDLSVTVLEGNAGGLLSNINRWRGQLGLPELTEDRLAGASNSIRPAGRAMTFVRFVSEDPLIDGKHKKSLMAAVYPAGGKTWFFKLVGEDRLVQTAERDFLGFLESLKGL